jgi:prevent-host-death family protein
MQVSKSKLKAKLLEYLRLAEAKGEEIIITDHGRPVLKIARYSTAPTTKELFGIMRGKVTYNDLCQKLVDKLPTLIVWLERKKSDSINPFFIGKKLPN